MQRIQAALTVPGASPAQKLRTAEGWEDFFVSASTSVPARQATKWLWRTAVMVEAHLVANNLAPNRLQNLTLQEVIETVNLLSRVKKLPLVAALDTELVQGKGMDASGNKAPGVAVTMVGIVVQGQGEEQHQIVTKRWFPDLRCLWGVRGAYTYWDLMQFGGTRINMDAEHVDYHLRSRFAPRRLHPVKPPADPRACAAALDAEQPATSMEAAKIIHCEGLGAFVAEYVCAPHQPLCRISNTCVSASLQIAVIRQQPPN